LTVRPVAGKVAPVNVNGPVWVAVMATSVATESVPTTRSSLSAWKSGKAVNHAYT
jgi:hypothetical protein